MKGTWCKLKELLEHLAAQPHGWWQETNLPSLQNTIQWVILVNFQTLDYEHRKN